MASWHQLKNQSALVALWTPPPTSWKCVADTPGEPASCMTFDNEADAKRYCEKTGDVLIAPRKNGGAA